MSDRVEVLPGPGTAVRYGAVVVWAGPTASPALLAFLTQSARNVGTSADGGRQIVDHIAGILATRDPEPGAPFAAVGPAEGGWAAVLHGPVQLWDGARWLAPSPTPGWLQSVVSPHVALSVGPAGSPSPRLVLESPYDLVTGMVPGGGVILVPDPAGAPTSLSSTSGVSGLATPDPAPSTPLTGVQAGEYQPGGVQAGAVQAGGVQAGEVQAGGIPPGGYQAGAAPPAAAATAPEPAPAPAPRISAVPPATAGGHTPVDLRTGPEHPRPALPGVADAIAMGATTSGSSEAGPIVPGVRCHRGHFNHPASRTCARCGLSLDGRVPESGPRPVIGVLIADDGTVSRLAGDLVAGSDPSTDPSVSADRAQPLLLTGPDGSVAPAHAELRLHDWTLSVVDRGSASGTFVVRPGETGWIRLTPFQPTTVRPGSHLAFGQRVLTFVSPWPT